jgi:Fe-S oxidoreductase
LWADTWNNYFHPRALHSAASVLTAAGYAVQTPAKHVCCGRPLYDFGFLDQARSYLAGILEQFAPRIDAGLPFVMLEPSCASVFRDELLNFFPHDERAIRLARQTMMLSEALTRSTNGWQPPQMPGRRIVLHGHCHQKSLMTMNDELSLLEATGAQVTMLDSGCCGMAGPFGFEADKFDISQALAERVLLPAVRAAQPSDLLVSNGFSCREQIKQNSPRIAVHLAQVMAGDAHDSAPPRPRPRPRKFRTKFPA